MFCTHCGSKVEDGNVFCTNCGAKLEQIPESATPAEEVFVVSEIEEAVEGADVQAVVIEEKVEDYGIKTLEEPIIDEAYEEESVGTPEVFVGDVDADASKEAEEIVIDDAVEEKTEAFAVEPTALDEKLDEIVFEKPVEVQPENTVKPTKNRLKKASVGAHICTTLVSILLALFLILTLAVASISSVFSSGVISNVIKEIDLANLDVETFSSKEELEKQGLKCESDNLLDVIYDNIDQSNLADPLTKNEYRDIVESEVFTDYMSKLINKKVDSAMSGKKTKLLESEDIITFMRSEKDEISKVVGYEITDERIENLEYNMDKKLNVMFDSLEINLGANAGTKAFTVVFADWLMPILILIDVLFCILIFIIVRSARIGLKYCGVTMLVVSLLFVLATVAAYFILTQILSVAVLADIASTVLLNVLIINLSVLGASILMLLIAFIIKKIQLRPIKVK